MIGQVTIESRVGNLLLGGLGVVYAVAAVVLLVYYFVQTWNAAGLIDRALQMVLVASAAVGVWFFLIARRNLQRSHQHA
ncbi:MAG TPA: hypothetical protein VNL91_11855 [Thermoanaerobaculia bacterium]|nr:hypothetical protein [Thermoanaerobaculia bacterium]